MAFHLKNFLYRKNKSLPANAGSAFLGIVFVIFIGILIALYIDNKTFEVDGKGGPTSLKETLVKEPVSIIFVGDIMLDRGVRGSVNKNFEGDYDKLFSNTNYLRDTDIAFANLEGPVANESGPRTGSKFSFRMDSNVLLAMHGAGFDVVSFANNHVGDYGMKAFRETLTHLEENNILYTGAGENYQSAVEVKIIDVRGMKVGFLAFSDVGPEWMKATDDRAGIILANDPNISEVILKAKQGTDILVVSFHFGNEYSPANIYQEKLAHGAIDAGADIVVGHHPHVMQKMEIYKDKPIFYSLGNFIFDQYFSPHTLQGMAVEVFVNPETLDITYQMSVSQMDKFYTPQLLIPFDESMLITKTFTP